MASSDDQGVTTINLRIPADESWVHIARLVASGVAARLDMDLDRLEDLKLAVSEACVDRLESVAAVDTIGIDFCLGADELVVEVAGDQPEDDPAEAAEDGGYALALMEAMVDGVGRRRTAEGVQVIQLFMRLDGPDESEPER